MFLLLIGTILLAYLFHELYWKRRNFPPGPMPLPILGNMLEVYRYEPGYDAYKKWRKEYGPVYTYWLGSIPVVAVTDYPTIKETFIKNADVYAGRFHIREMTKLYRGGEYGVVETEGELWREQRRFTLHALRDFGMGKNMMEERVHVEVDALLERLNKNKGHIYMQREFDIGIGSIINNILFGYRFDDDKLEEFYEVKGAITRQMKEFANPLLFMMMMMPWLRFFPVFNSAWKRLFDYRDALFGFFHRQIEKKEAEIDPEAEDCRDFVECFFKERKKHENEEDFGGYTNAQLENLVFDLWVAGMETTSNTLCWGVCYILNNPGVQMKIHHELDSVIQSDRKITLGDRNDLPYLNATICEIQRMANLLPQNLFHSNLEDVVIKGFSIEKKTCIIPQISCVLYDEEVFPDPYAFDPTRFLNNNGSLRKIEELIPFSIGKRQCIGEGLARMELFLFLANILQRFQIRCDELPSTKKTFGTTVQAQPFTCYMVERHR